MKRYLIIIIIFLTICVFSGRLYACTLTPKAAIYPYEKQYYAVGSTQPFHTYFSYDPDNADPPQYYCQGITYCMWGFWNGYSWEDLGGGYIMDYAYYDITFPNTAGEYKIGVFVRDDDELTEEHFWDQDHWDLAECQVIVLGVTFETPEGIPAYLKPTPAGYGTDQVESPIVKYGDTLYFKFKIKIYPTGVSGVKLHKTTVALTDGSSDLASESHTYSGTYTEATEVSGSYINHLTIPNTIVNGSQYSFRIDVDIDKNGSILNCIGVSATPVYANAQAVEIGRMISGEDNTNDNSRAAVANTILNRWNFPTITNGHDFTRSALIGSNSTIYQLATDTGIFHGSASLNNTVQNAREWGRYILDNPNSANGNGPIYFYAASASSGMIYDLCNDADDPEVNLLTLDATYGNKYFKPSSNPNNWVTQTIKNGYDADGSDSLSW